jgi:hypothetical protein
MLYNILRNADLKTTLAIPADEGLADIAFANGWRVLIPARQDKHIHKSIERREAWEWGIYLYDLASGDEIPLMADDSRFSPYVEDVADELDEEDQWMELDDPADDADTEVPFDYVETFHHLNQQ